jgi:hypothetical protein
MRSLVVAVFLFFVLMALAADGATIEYRFPNQRSIDSIVFTADGRAWAETSAGIVRLDADGTSIAVAPDTNVTALVVGSDGAVWTSRLGEIVRIDPSTSTVQRVSVPFSLRVFTAGPDGQLWGITSTADVVRFNTAGQIVSSATAARPAPPPQYSVVSAGAWVWTVSGGNQLVRWSADGTTQAFPLGTIQPYPNWIVSAGDFLWVAEDQFPRVTRVSLTGEILGTYPVPGLSIYGVAAEASGNLLISDEFTGDILRITPDGTLSRLIALPRTASSCLEYGPEPIALSPDGSMAAIGRSFTLNPVSPPYDPCRTDPGAASRVLVFSPAHLGDIPTLDRAAFLAFALLMAGLGVFKLFRG